MATAYQSIATATGAPDLTINKPSGLAEGDLMIAFLGISDVGLNSTATWTLSGWTEIAQQRNANTGGAILVKVASSGDASASNFTFTSSEGAGDAVGALVRISGSAFSGSANIVVSVGESENQNPTFATPLTPISPNSLLFMFVVGGQVTNVDYSSYAIANSNPTWTEIADVDDASGTDDCSIGVAWASYAPSTSTGNFSVATSSDAGGFVGFLLSVKENTNASANPSTVTITATPQAPTVVAGATVSVSALSQTFSVQTPTISTQSIEWTNESIPSASVWTEETP